MKNKDLVTNFTKLQCVTSNLSLADSTLNATNDAVYWILPNAKIIHVNKASCDMLGYSYGELTSFELYKINPNVSTTIWHKLWNNIKAGNTLTAQTKHLTSDGELISVSITANYTIIDNQEYAFAIVRNITTQKELELSEEKFRQMFENMGSGVAIYEAIDNGSDFVFKNFNAAAEKIEKIKRELIIGKRITEAFPRVGEFGFLDALTNVYRSGKSRNFTVAYYDKNVVAGWRENFIYKLPDGEVVAIYEDITKQKQAEDILKENEERLKLATNSGDIGIWEWDIVNNILIWDDKMFALYGAKATDFTGAYDAWAARMHPDDRDEQEKLSIDVRDNSKPYDTEFRVLHLDGSVHYLKASAVVIRDKNNKATKMIGANWDITKQKETEESIKKLNKELEQKVKEESSIRIKQEKLLMQQSKMALIGGMIQAIAHQWRQPLNKLVSYIMLIKGGFGNKKHYNETEVLEMVTKMEGIAEHLSDTMEHFITFFQPTKKQESFFINQTILYAVEIFKTYIDSEKVIVELQNSKDFEITSYPKELIQVIDIILSNALDAFVENKINNPQVNITLKQNKNSTCIKIYDNAGGIKDDILEKIFEPYFSTKSNTKMGIGLYIARLIIEKSMRGKLNANNYKNGANFTITLPNKIY